MQTTPHGKASQVELYVSFELTVKKWELSLSDGRRGLDKRGSPNSNGMRHTGRS